MHVNDNRQVPRDTPSMWTKRLASSSVVLVVVAGIASLASGLVALVRTADLPDQPVDACADPPCWNLDVDGSSLLVVLPFIAHALLLGLALFVGGLALLFAVAAAVRGGGRDALGPAAVAVIGPLLVLAGGELVPHLLNPCVIPELAGAESPGFCISSPQGADVPDRWHALDHAVVGFFPLSLLMAWWWRRRGSRRPTYSGGVLPCRWATFHSPSSRR